MITRPNIAWKKMAIANTSIFLQLFKRHGYMEPLLQNKRCVVKYIVQKSNKTSSDIGKRDLLLVIFSSTIGTSEWTKRIL
mmetsp:Transcript_106113/g.305089  ORF Transcript_106113/g.305089 Transcript_106113/m.305089 type:complete len:80 (-) Transcript_106113:19-258(-)